MKHRKERLTVTVDRALIRAANEAVAAGRASSLSGWVNRALSEHAERERRLLALAGAVADYEKQFGVISEAELAAQERADRRSSIVVRGGSPARRTRRSRR
jgi:hypothetical protein